MEYYCKAGFPGWYGISTPVITAPVAGLELISWKFATGTWISLEVNSQEGFDEGKEAGEIETTGKYSLHLICSFSAL